MSRVDTAADGDPALRILGLDLDQTARAASGLLEASERQQRLAESPPGQRMVRGLLEGMAQQALGIVRPSAARESAASPHSAAT